jgi:hypothetical protein
MWHEQNESLRCSELLSLCVRSSSGFVLPGICLSRSHSAAALVTLLPRQGLDPLLISRHVRNKLLSIRLCCLTCDVLESRISIAESCGRNNFGTILLFGTLLLNYALARIREGRGITLTSPCLYLTLHYHSNNSFHLLLTGTFVALS